jgi:endonuclease YncB( thermonuclease family)
MRTLFQWLCLTALTVGAQAIEKTEGVWTVIEDCRLEEAFFSDGDSFLVQAGGESLTFRLYYVDALETGYRYMYRVGQQAEYFDLPVDRVAEGGKAATDFTRDFLDGPFTIITKWDDARGSSTNKRYFAFIRKDGQYLSEQLVANGLARIYGKPAETRWPGGPQPYTYQSQLRELEVKAKNDKRGLWGWEGSAPRQRPTTNIREARIADRAAATNSGEVDLESVINVNTASLEALQTLNGIGPVLAARIIDARPIESIESLVYISGISARKLAEIKERIIVEEPPPPPETIAFYKADLDRYLNTQVTVRVAEVRAEDIDSPPGFHAATMTTAYEGLAGGATTAFVPEEFYDSFLRFYEVPGRSFTALLHRHGGQIVLVFQRK